MFFVEVDKGVGKQGVGEGQDRFKVREKVELGLFQNQLFGEGGRR